MQHLIGLTFLAFFALALVIWFLTLRWGLAAGAYGLCGLAFLALLSGAASSSHAEAVMGRGLEVLFIWLPAAAGAAVGYVVGWLHRRNR